ncbi:hypothetical protein [Shewanella sp. AC34-MNA-CIBAN-0136]|uniref:hypothetical protein n=1 Tax=Shewanella sp. AC34-MNA-CIBAN-0136 TaxID=3140463 RepID=UPI003321C4B2
MIQEGIAVDPLLARAGWNLAILVQTKFENSGVGEAPRRWWAQAIKRINPAGWNLAMLSVGARRP